MQAEAYPAPGAPARHGRIEGLPVRRVVHWMEDAFESYVAFTLRLLGDPARAVARREVKLAHALQQAHVAMRPEAFLAFAWMNTLVALLVGCVLLGLGVGLAALLGRPPALPLAVALLTVPLVLAGSVYLAQTTWPDHRAGERRRLIERELPYAVNYIAALSSAGVIPTTLLRDLAREPTYGEVAREAAWMVRDIDLLGLDLITALQRGIERSPSRRFQEFLQGAKTTILSGGDLKVYFAAKAEQYMADNRRTQKEFLESLGIMAESYVTVVIAGPLFMMVMLSIMLVIGKATASSEVFLFFLVFVMLPVAHAGFSWVMKNLTVEGSS